MYGTVARYQVKPGMMQKLLDYEAMIRTLGMKALSPNLLSAQIMTLKSVTN